MPWEDMEELVPTLVLILAKLGTSDTSLATVATEITTMDTSVAGVDASLTGLIAALTEIADAVNGQVQTLQSVSLDHTDFTDNTDATGFISTGITIPEGSVLESVKYEWDEAPGVNGADGETNIECQLGTVADPDRCNQATDPDTVIATGLPATFYQDPRNPADVGDGDIVFDAAETLVLLLTLSGGTPDFTNFVNAGGSGKITVTAVFRKMLSL